MSSIEQNRHIARLLVGAMSIDGSLDSAEQQKLAKTLSDLGMEELLADVGAAFDEDQSNFNMFKEAKLLRDSLGTEADEYAPVIFQIIAQAVASDRFVSEQEASYLSALARRLRIEPEVSKEIFKTVLTELRSKIEVSGKQIDETLHPHLKELLSFSGAEQIVGQVNEDSLDERLHNAKEKLDSECDFTLADVRSAMEAMGLSPSATYDEAEEYWKNTIKQLNLPQMAALGESFVTAALGRINKIHDAFRIVSKFNAHVETVRRAENDVEIIEGQIKRSRGPSSRNALAVDLETSLTGVGTAIEE